MIQATDGEAAAGRPVVEIEGRQYRVHRLTVRSTPLVKVKPAQRSGYSEVVTYEPIGEG